MKRKLMKDVFPKFGAKETKSHTGQTVKQSEKEEQHKMSTHRDREHRQD